MSTDERRAEPSGLGFMPVFAVLGPVLAGTATVIFLLVGYTVSTVDPKPAFAQKLVEAGWYFGALTALIIPVSAVLLLITALRSASQAVEEEGEAPTRTVHPSNRAAQRTLDFASFVAGERRAHLREEWAAILAGDPGNGIVLSPRRRLRYAIGFLWAALRMRLRDLVAPLWMPVDWLLSAEPRTNGFIALAVGAQVVYIQYHDGLHALVTEGWGWCAGCGIALRLAVNWLRRIRGIELVSVHGDSGDQ
ncbi:hypothetical protein [Streptomyces sp. NPDC029004]|uniref:hypothetical protein n=1 Tax=Streptomyces sp. NPDC029004 TaxID=3154490 RepID=UPI0033D7F4C8